MIEAYGQEDIKTQVSTDLTNILRLYCKLQTNEDVRQTPDIISSILPLINDLEKKEQKYYGFSEILHENIEQVERNSQVLKTPSVLRAEEGTKGLRKALYELTWPLIEPYCNEERKFLSAKIRTTSKKIRYNLLLNAKTNCGLLFAFCLPQESILLLDLKIWCESKMDVA
jgi:hypothetical protein